MGALMKATLHREVHYKIDADTLPARAAAAAVGGVDDDVRRRRDEMEWLFLTFYHLSYYFLFLSIYKMIPC
jgi:hypothetical protein